MLDLLPELIGQIGPPSMVYKPALQRSPCGHNASLVRGGRENHQAHEGVITLLGAYLELDLMNRTLRIVPVTEWALGPEIASRHSCLLDVTQPDKLLAKVIEEASRSAKSGLIRLRWQEADECQGYFRLVAQIPLEQEATFDQFFNGRSGYRAQYYLSPEEGVLYNWDVLLGLKDVLSIAYHQQPLAESLEVVLRTIDGPHAKVWVFDERAAFDSSPVNSLNPQRWINNNACRGRRTPLPSHLTLDIKGTFIKPFTGELFVDPLKIDRACDLFRNGYS